MFDLNNIEGRVSLGYELGEITLLRAGMRYQSSPYLRSENSDKESAEIYAGLNQTLPANNCLDIEVGYGIMDYKFIDPTRTFVSMTNPEGALVGGHLRSFYVSPRLSRPLGRKTGLNLTFAFRSFMNTGDETVFGSSVGLLSPWTSVWEGTSVAATLKSYLIPQLISSAGIGYWNRRHLETLENDQFPAVVGKTRDDDQIRIYLQIMRPILLKSGALIQPRLQLDYTSNNSTNELFDYSAFSINTGISVRL
jgi:hypothetical protein